MEGAFWVAIVFNILALVIFFIIVRMVSRASENVELSTGICRNQSKQLLLLEKVVGDKLGIDIDDAFYLQTSELGLVKTLSVTDFYKQDGSLDQNAIAKLASLYNAHHTAVGERGYSIIDAGKLFDSYVNNLISSLPEVEKTAFINTYRTEKVTERE